MRALHTAALAVALAWMAAAAALVGWAAEAGWVARHAALPHWLFAGVLPAALALASLPGRR